MIRDTIPAEELLHKAHAVGQYYGFTPLSTLTEASRGCAKVKNSDDNNVLTNISLDPIAETVIGFLKQCRDAACLPTQRHPKFIWHTNIAHGRPAQKRAIIQFHALGSDRAIADTVVIHAILALVRDIYHEEPIIRINSMGDKETRARYARELANFFKKNAESLPDEFVSRARQDVLHAAELVISRDCADDLPASTEHLSDASRKRFEDLLEYLEMTEIQYELARTLISRGSIWNDNCFDVKIGERRVAWGSRYNDLARHVFHKTPFSATGAVIQVTSTGNMVKKITPQKLRFSFIHIGDEAKRLSIKLAEEFRRAKISLVQDIGVESITEQINLVEKRNSPYLLIMGRKEALEGSAILRNRQTQEETILPIAGIAERLKSVA